MGGVATSDVITAPGFTHSAFGRSFASAVEAMMSAPRIACSAVLQASIRLPSFALHSRAKRSRLAAVGL